LTNSALAPRVSESIDWRAAQKVTQAHAEARGREADSVHRNGPRNCSANLLHGHCRRGAIQRMTGNPLATEFKPLAVFLRIYFGMKKNVAN
jgi:hypothetical protein